MIASELLSIRVQTIKKAQMKRVRFLNGKKSQGSIQWSILL